LKRIFLRSDTTEIILENKNIFLTKKKDFTAQQPKAGPFPETGQLFN
jgi:hypothetical protein